MKPRFSSRYDWRVVAARSGCGGITAAVCLTRELVDMCSLALAALAEVT